MAVLLTGKEVAAAIDERSAAAALLLKESGVTPLLAIVRVGKREDDLTYERMATKRCEKVGVAVQNVVLPGDVAQDALEDELRTLAEDDNVHGILLFRPLPKGLHDERACALIPPDKDVDGATIPSQAGVFMNRAIGFAPCTAQAVMEMLSHYDISVAGKKVCVIGRSLVIGRPVAMLLMHANATPVICHTKTADVPALAKEADILVAASGQMESIGADFVRAGQTVIDVGIGWNEEKQKLCGDVRFDEVAPVVSAITPVPGGVGSVTTSILVSHVIEAARRETVLEKA